LVFVKQMEPDLLDAVPDYQQTSVPGDDVASGGPSLDSGIVPDL